MKRYGSMHAMGQAACAGLLLVVTAFAFAQSPDQPWSVWEKVDPCVDSRQDWFTVAKNYPGAPSVWEPAAGPFDSFAEAFADADLRKQAPRNPDFRRVCCDDWAVLRSDAGGTPTFSAAKLSAGAFQPPNTIVERGGLCCEEAFDAAGLSAAGQNDCRSIRLGDGTLVTLQNGVFVTNPVGPGAGPGAGSGSFGQINQNAGLGGKTLRFYGATTPEACQADCEKDPQCQGFTFMRAGAHVPTDPKMCYLMSVASEFQPSPCCISGIRGPAPVSAPTGPASTDPCVCKSRCPDCEGLPSLLCEVAGAGPKEQACRACMSRCE